MVFMRVNCPDGNDCIGHFGLLVDDEEQLSETLEDHHVACLVANERLTDQVFVDEC